MKGSLREIALSELGDTVGTPPSQTLMGSVRRHGVMQPVVVAETPDEEGVIGLRVVDGNRRIAAARSACMKHLPAIVLTDVAQEELSTITLVLNGFRASNYLTEFWAIKQLEREGVNEADISAISGLTRGKVDQRTSLSDLSRELFVALRNGKIYQTHAAEIAKMPPESQAVLADIFRRHGRLTQYDLAPHKVRKSSRGRTPVESSPAPSISWDAETSQYRGRPASDPADDGLLPANPEPHNSSVPHLNERKPQEAFIEVSPSVIPDSEMVNSSAVISQVSNGQGHGTESVVSAMEASPLETVSAFSSRLQSLMRNTVVAARDLDYSKEEFLEMAARKWDEVNG